MNKKIMRITLILCTIACGVWTIWRGKLIVEKYEANMAEIDALQTPVEIVDKYMYDEYNGYWRDLDDVNYAYPEEWITYLYKIEVVEHIDQEKHFLFYTINESAENGIGCQTVTGYPGTSISSWYHYQESNIVRMDCTVDVYGGKMKGWIQEPFQIYYIDGQYYMCRNIEDTFVYLSEAEVAEIEAKTGLTLEEMVDIAYDAQAKLEELIYDVKEQAKVVEKERMIQRLVILSILPLCLIGMGIVYEIMMRKSRAKKEKEV